MATGSLAEARSHNVPPDTFLRHYREIRDAKDAHADTGMALARAKKAAKGDGIDLDALKLLEKFADLDTDEAEMRLRHLRLYAEWIELPIGAQNDMFGQPPPPKPDEEETQKQRDFNAKAAGKTAGQAGHERQTNPHSPGTSEHVAWDKAWLAGHKGWLKGQETIASEMAPADELPLNGAAVGRAKRGRPRSNGASAPAH
jgi:hypothetical protein